jgi:hypothetical protein
LSLEELSRIKGSAGDHATLFTGFPPVENRPHFERSSPLGNINENNFFYTHIRPCRCAGNCLVKRLRPPLADDGSARHGRHALIQRASESAVIDDAGTTGHARRIRPIGYTGIATTRYQQVIGSLRHIAGA